jgi:hypothetical protein
VRDFRDKWEQVEKDNLERDVLKRIENMQNDKHFKEQGYEV